MLARRSAISPQERLRMDAELTARVLDWWRRNPLRCLGVYWPIRGEPDLSAAYRELIKHGVQLALPIITDADSPLQFAAWSPGAAVIPGAMKVPIPAPPRLLVQPDGLLIPCLGFNQSRIRLGYGGGFYDRTLAADRRPLAIGVAYQCLSADFSADGHDIAMDVLITEVTELTEITRITGATEDSDASRLP
jgi:5-formyltetrahydrofolate cyclo-ligase